MKDLIDFAEFTKVDLRVGQIKEAKLPEESEHLIQLLVDFGEEGERTIFAGIKKWYEPEELEGKKLVFVLNMKPKKTPFGESEGMLLAVDDKEGKPKIIELDNSIETGASLR